MSKRHIRRIVIFLAIALILSYAVFFAVNVWTNIWLMVETQGEFTFLKLEMADHLASHPDDTPAEIKKGVLEGYAKRTGKKVPLDAWGRRITVKIIREDSSVVNSSIIMEMRSAGVDGVTGTPDDVVQQSGVMRRITTTTSAPAD